MNIHVALSAVFLTVACAYGPPPSNTINGNNGCGGSGGCGSASHSSSFPSQQTQHVSNPAGAGDYWWDKNDNPFQNIQSSQGSSGCYPGKRGCPGTSTTGCRPGSSGCSQQSSSGSQGCYDGEPGCHGSATSGCFPGTPGCGLSQQTPSVKPVPFPRPRPQPSKPHTSQVHQPSVPFPRPKPSAPSHISTGFPSNNQIPTHYVPPSPSGSHVQQGCTLGTPGCGSASIPHSPSNNFPQTTGCFPGVPSPGCPGSTGVCRPGSPGCGPFPQPPPARPIVNIQHPPANNFQQPSCTHGGPGCGQVQSGNNNNYHPVTFPPGGPINNFRPIASNLIPSGSNFNGMPMMMMPMGVPLIGSSCSASLYCVERNTCNPYTGFIIRNINMVPAVVEGQGTVPLMRCFVPAGNIQDGVCCQESHPIIGLNGQVAD